MRMARGAKLLGVIEGCGEMADSFHRTRSSPDGRPIIGCIRNAIADAGLTPDDIDYVNPHGTGTPENDKMEGLAATAVFGERAKQLPISSNKSMIGHTLSAAGAVEAVITLLTLDRQLLPPTINYQVPDPALQLDVVPNVARAAKVAPRALQFLRLRRPERLAGAGQRAGVIGASMPASMRALTIVADRKLELVERRAAAAARPPARCRSASRRWRSTISTCGAGAAWPSPSASCRWWSAPRRPARSRRSGRVSTPSSRAQAVVMYGGLTCGICKACREGRDNLCENIAGIMGFHVDGFARDLLNMPARLVIPVPAGVAMRATPPARRSHSRPCSTCCSTMPGSRPARACWCMPAARASAPRRS